MTKYTLPTEGRDVVVYGRDLTECIVQASLILAKRVKK